MFRRSLPSWGPPFNTYLLTFSMVQSRSWEANVHHQEFFTVHTAVVYAIQVCRQLARKFEKLVHLVGFIIRKNRRCLYLHCATSAPLFTAYLICLYSEWLAYLCFSCYIAFVSNLFSSLFYIDILHFYSGFGGLGVACWPLVPKFADSNPAEADGFLGRKNPQHAFLRRGSKAVGTMS